MSSVPDCTLGQPDSCLIAGGTLTPPCACARGPCGSRAKCRGIGMVPPDRAVAQALIPPFSTHRKRQTGTPMAEALRQTRVLGP